MSSGAGHGVSGEIDVEVVLGEPTGGVAHGRGLGEDLEAGLPQAGAGGCIGIGGVPHHHRLVIRAGVISQQVIRHGAVGGVGRGDHHVVDQLGVGIDRQVGLVAVESAVLGLVPVAGLGIHSGDDPVAGHAPHDAEDPVVAWGHVLARHQGQ